MNTTNNCHYFDGKSAALHLATIVLSNGGFTIRGESGDRLAVWDFCDTDIVEEDSAAFRLRLSNSKHFGARLVVEGEAFGQIIEALAKACAKPNQFRARHLFFALPMVLALCVAGFAVYGPPVVDSLLAKVPLSVDKSLGQRVHALIAEDEDFVVCENKEADAALQKIVQRLAGVANAEFDFTVRVVASDTDNAFALPGGYVTLYSGLIDQAESPEEVAGVLAHEMAHVIKRHGVQALIKQMGVQFVLFAAVGDSSSAVDLGSMLLMMHMSREEEAEADAIGAAILGKAKLSVAGLKSYFERLVQQDEDTEYLTLLDSHPLSETRAQALIDPPGLKTTSLLTAKEWKALRGYCEAYKPS